MANKQVHIVSGGTIFHVRPHLALTPPEAGEEWNPPGLVAPAFGETGHTLKKMFEKHPRNKMDVSLHLTKLAGGQGGLTTNVGVDRLIDSLIADPATKIVIMATALLDVEGHIDDGGENGKYGTRLQSRAEELPDIKLTAAPKIIPKLRKTRKDIFAVGFKTTCGATEDQQYIAALHLLKSSSLNLVLANDVKTRTNMIVTPEEARYHVTTDRNEALQALVDMSLERSHLTFTRSTVVAGEPISWDSPLVPDSLRKVVDHCVARGAYKPFRGATVGHFAVKVNETMFLTSIRKSNFNDLDKIGLVKCITDGPDSVIAYGAKPSVGGQSQRIVFNDHRDSDCIVHFHCPIREGSKVPVVSQREYECGSHECGQNTSRGLQKFGNKWAVYLDEHGPNIVFNRDIDPQEVIDFIEENFDLTEKTGGYVSLGQILNTPETVEELMNLTQENSHDSDSYSYSYSY